MFVFELYRHILKLFAIQEYFKHSEKITGILVKLTPIESQNVIY